MPVLLLLLMSIRKFDMGIKIKQNDVAECPLSHIAFIMDGNGRWAKKRGLPREYGHKQGAKTFEKIMDYCLELGIKATTFYVFSTENWKRSEHEVKALMVLLEDYIDECRKQVEKGKRKTRFVFLGDKAPFSQSLIKKMQELEQISSQYEPIVNLAINYGGRNELVHAFNLLLAQGKQDINEQDIAGALYTKDSPELDMVVRTGGDIRISNFLLWQTAYAELYFTDKLWPDFSKEDVDAAINDFKNRQRRFGGV